MIYPAHMNKLNQTKTQPIPLNKFKAYDWIKNFKTKPPATVLHVFTSLKLGHSLRRSLAFQSRLSVSSSIMYVSFTLVALSIIYFVFGCAATANFNMKLKFVIC